MKKRLNSNQISEIKQLATAGFSLNYLSAKFNLRKSTIYYHAKDRCRKMTKLNLSQINDCDKGYFIGLFLGDGSFNKGKKTNRFFVRFALDAKRDSDIASHLSHIFGKAGKKMSLFQWKSNIIAKVCSKELVDYIQQIIVYEKCSIGKREKILISKENWSVDFKYGIIAGIIDSDGHVHKHLGTEIKTVSNEIFKAISSLFNELNVRVNTKVSTAPENSFSKQPRYVIYVPSQEMKRHSNNIHSQIPLGL